MKIDTFAATAARLSEHAQRSDEYLEQLQSEVKGRVILRHDAGYDAARRGWNLTIDQRPALIVAADQATKWWILEQVMMPPRVIPISPFFNLVMTWNCDWS